MVDPEVSKIMRQALPILVFCALFELGAGSLLGGMEDKFSMLPGLLIMVPPLLGFRGNISGALASRISSGLHQGIIDPEVLWGEEVDQNLKASIFLSFVVSLLTGFLSFLVTVLTGMYPSSFYLLSVLVSVALMAGLVSSLILTAFTVIVASFSYRRGWDPDNVTSPFMATMGDLVTVASIYLAIFLVV